MSSTSTLEQTYLKVPCRSCGQVTPHRDNSTTLQCEVCLTSNFPLSVNLEYYSGWELAAFWQQKYRSVVGYGVPVMGHSIRFGVVDSQGDCYASGCVVNTGRGVLLAEPIPEGVLVSPVKEERGLNSLQIEISQRIMEGVRKAGVGVPCTLSAAGTLFTFTLNREGSIDVTASLDPNSIGTL